VSRSVLSDQVIAGVHQDTQYHAMCRDKVIVEGFNPFVVFADPFMDGLQYDRAQVNSVYGNKCATDAKASISRFFHAFAPLVRRGEQADNLIYFVESGIGN
jgi:hypothetical protein